ncbi:MAG: metalloprotease TldD [Candidatus Rokubacteria bacterium]|nr:metalloprotease TldD [Candidatus Rokubacteria bacterium]
MAPSRDLPAPERFFADRYGLTAGRLERLLGSAAGGRVDYADVFIEHQVGEELLLEDGVVKKASRSISQGAGVRAQAGVRTGYAYTDDLGFQHLELAARQAQAIADRGGDSAVVPVQGERRPHDLYSLAEPPVDAALERKVDLLRRIDALGRAYDPRVRQVITSLWSEEQVILIATSRGFQIGDVRPLTRLNVTVVVEENGRREIGAFGGGGRVGFDFFLESERWALYTREAARQAVLKLRALNAPAGTMTVVLGPGWPGILLHEAVGHGLEGDFNRKGVSAFTERIGQKVASDLVTVVDDGTLPNRRGSLNVDDEGTPTGRALLIENGVLRGYMQDRLNARLLGMPLTGNGRRESFQHPPMPRMTNTFMLAGQDDPEEIIRSVSRGLFAVAFGGGQVDITNGKFVFSASEAYLIEDGRVTAPVKGATLIGSGPEVLTRVSRVGYDLKLDEGIGTCGKDGQSVPVGVGLPTIRVDGITVGGTEV